MTDEVSPPARTRTGRPPRSEQQKGELRTRVAHEAVRLFAQRGVTATTGEAIASAAGISVRTLWRHFPSKESCVRPFLDEALTGAAELLRHWPADTSLVDFLRQCYAAGVITPPGDELLTVLALMHREPALRTVWLEVHEDALPVFAELLAARWGASARSLEVRVHAATLNGALRAAVEEYERDADPREDPTACIFAHLDAALSAASRGFPT
ncbi:TetR family transcriptional regulator [Mumia zhuanghuii]|uniref:TetR/AcrR family transcriptional regulator n=2 Tax=Mumia TaxID=1546255 RepID=A0ABW1QI26_9ACTN|nr:MULTISPECIES: TetR/AcrR family transcriptional regulator [Mumia]KAA1418278.1 TetR family transcriptional regulator [Mumia zhuanghuii]